MSARIEQNDNMFYVENEGTPWHGLGTPVGHTLTSAEAIEAASLDWDVEMVPVYVAYQDIPGFVIPKYREVPNRKAVMRKDTGDVFHIATDMYQPVQNRAAFEFMDSLAAEGGIKYHTAGSLFNGKRIWLLAKLQGSVFVRGERLDKYLLLHNAHDGSSSLSVQFTAIRVVCNNTCNFALGDKTNQFRARHTTNIMTKVKSAADILGLADDHFNTLAETGQRMAEKHMTKFSFMALTRKLFDIEGVKWEDLKAPMQQQLSTLDDLFVNGPGNGGNTAWDGFNAFTEYTDHDAIIGRKLDTISNNAVAVQEKRLDRAWFGSGATLKQAAWNELVDFVGVN